MSKSKAQTTKADSPQTILPISTSGFVLEATKKQVLAAAKQVGAFPDPAKALAMAKRLKAFAEAAEKVLKPILSEKIGEGEEIQVLGARIYFKGGGFAFKAPASYQHDPEWCRLRAELDAREELMRTAEKNRLSGPIFDQDGAEVPPAVKVQVSPSLMCDY